MPHLTSSAARRTFTQFCRPDVWGVVVALAGCAALMVATPARGAVRVCKPMQLGGVATDVDERVARTKAMRNWTGKVRKFGDDFTAWRLAVQRSLQCKPSAAGFRCAAAGRPCRIFQKAPR